MREIIYAQAGPLANYIGTHFWNTQQAYFTYEDGEGPAVVHDVSFREGSTHKREPTYCPRLLIFDRKANFGTLSKSNALFGPETEEETENGASPSLWNGDVVEYRQESVAKSAYQNSMEQELDDGPSFGDVQARGGQERDREIRYWSDFNRVYYIPRTVQKLPDTAEWENTEGDWNNGRDSFAQFNEDSALIEDSLRLFVEECDALQGIHVMNDTATFGSFIDSFLTSFRDEYLKIPSIIFPLLSDVLLGQIDVDDSQSTKKAINDALCLRGLNELSSMNIPIRSPSTWSADMWQGSLELDQENQYHTSAVLSAHIENSTFPLRMKGSEDTVASFCGQLDWRGMTCFGQLSGAFPASAALETSMRNLSAIEPEKAGTQFARRDVSRGFSRSDVLSYETWCNGLPLPSGFIASVHAPAYPLPTSFPSFFKSPRLNASGRGGLLAPTRSAPLFTSVVTGSGTADLFSTYARFVEDCVRRKADVGVGVDRDELRDLGNDLWTLHDNFADGNTGLGGNDDDSMGEDEE